MSACFQSPSHIGLLFPEACVPPYFRIFPYSIPSDWNTLPPMYSLMLSPHSPDFSSTSLLQDTSPGPTLGLVPRLQALLTPCTFPAYILSSCNQIIYSIVDCLRDIRVLESKFVDEYKNTVIQLLRKQGNVSIFHLALIR